MQIPDSIAPRLHSDHVKQASSCGCEAGTWGVLLSLGVYLLGSVGLPILLAQPVSATWGWGIAVAVAGGVVGKSLGMWWGRSHG